MKIAVAQVAIGEDVEQNLHRIIHYLGRAKSQGVDFLCFPEMGLTGYTKANLSAPDLNERMDANLALIEEECRTLGIGTIVGYPYIVDGKLKNRATALLPGGDRCSYDKINLVDVEKSFFTPGDAVTTFPLGRYTAGIIICRDISFPDLVREVRDMGADILFVPTAHYYPAKEGRWKIARNRALPIARATDNEMYVLVANPVGSHVHLTSLGESIIADPEGVLVALAGECEEAILSVDLIDHPRERMV